MVKMVPEVGPSWPIAKKKNNTRVHGEGCTVDAPFLVRFLRRRYGALAAPFLVLFLRGCTGRLHPSCTVSGTICTAALRGDSCTVSGIVFTSALRGSENEQ
jgi:hypothetical protein